MVFVFIWLLFFSLVAFFVGHWSGRNVAIFLMLCYVFFSLWFRWWFWWCFVCGVCLGGGIIVVLFCLRAKTYWLKRVGRVRKRLKDFGFWIGKTSFFAGFLLMNCYWQICRMLDFCFLFLLISIATYVPFDVSKQEVGKTTSDPWYATPRGGLT